MFAFLFGNAVLFLSVIFLFHFSFVIWAGSHLLCVAHIPHSMVECVFFFCLRFQAGLFCAFDTRSNITFELHFQRSHYSATVSTRQAHLWILFLPLMIHCYLLEITNKTHADSVCVCATDVQKCMKSKLVWRISCSFFSPEMSTFLSHFTLHALFTTPNFDVMIFCCCHKKCH